MEMVIRDYEKSDYAACRSLWGEMAQHHAEIYKDPSIVGKDPGRGFDEYLRRTDLYSMWVAESDGNVVGFAGLLKTVGEEGVAEIEPVVTTNALRSRGFGTRLIKKAASEAKEKGFRFLTIKPVLRNEKAFNLYVRLGFDHIGAVELFQDLSPESNRKWQSGIVIHGKELSY